MKQGTTYNRDQAFALLLIGLPKSGKTIIGTSFPNVFVLDLDLNLNGALSHHGDEMGNFFFDDLSDEPNQDKRWTASHKALVEACKSDEVDTVFVDGLTVLAQLLQMHILANSKKGNGMDDLVIAGEKVMNRAQWGPFKNLMTKIIMMCRASGKKLIFSCHEDTITDKNGAVLSYRPMIPGALKHNIAGLFTDVWRCESGTKANKPYHRIRFAPKNMMQIGNSLGIKDIEYDTTDKTKKEIWSYLSKHFN